jgi:hypothetical protein
MGQVPMKITVEDDDDKVTEYRNVTDIYFAIRQLEPMVAKDEEKLAVLPETRSFSLTSGHLRELVKEMRQSIIELECIMNDQFMMQRQVQKPINGKKGRVFPFQRR